MDDLRRGTKPILTIDGERFNDFSGFCREFSRLLDDHTWNGSLDAFNDILRGGFGTPETGFVLQWLNSDLSRSILNQPAPASDKTLFQVLVEIIEDHGPNGQEPEDGIDLELA